MKLFKTQRQKNINEIGVKVLPEPTEKRISIDEIQFDQYQRELKMPKTKRIVKEFIPDIVGVILVSYRNGKYWCIDGQHRLEALKELGYKDVRCDVLYDLTYEDECKMFCALNTGRTQLSANQIFHSKVEGKQKEAVELVDLFQKYNFDYSKNNSYKADNCIGAVSKFSNIQKKYGLGMVDRVLRVLREAWLGQKDALSSSIISGLCTFLHNNIDCDDDVLIKALEKIAPNMLIIQANNYVKMEMLRPGRSDSACFHVAKIIENLYFEKINKSKAKKQRDKESIKEKITKNIKKIILKDSFSFGGDYADSTLIEKIRKKTYKDENGATKHYKIGKETFNKYKRELLEQTAC